MFPVYECVIYFILQEIRERAKDDHFYLVVHKKAQQTYLRLRAVCKMWNEIVQLMLPPRKHIKISPHNEAEFEQKLVRIANSTDVSVYLKSHITLFCANKCALRKLHVLGDYYSSNITKLFVEEFPCPDTNVPILLSKLTNLQQLHISRAHWSTKFKFESLSLRTITLQCCLGMKTMKFLCPSLSLFVFDRGILEIPFLEDVGERKLRFVIQSRNDVTAIVKGLNLNNLKLHCNTKLYVTINHCLGVYFKLSSRSPMDVLLRKCVYSSVLIEGEKVDKIEILNMKLKVLKLRCARLQNLTTTDCAIKVPDFNCPKLFQSHSNMNSK